MHLMPRGTSVTSPPWHTNKRSFRQAWASVALGAVESAEAVPALVEVLKDPADSARVPAAFTLGRIGPPAKDAESALSKGLEEKDPVLKEVKPGHKVL